MTDIGLTPPPQPALAATLFHNQTRALEKPRQPAKTLQRWLHTEGSALLGPGSGALRRDRADWVEMWVDWSHEASSACGRMTAYRAITRRGRPIWYVFRTGKRKGYHSAAAIPEAAFAETLRATQGRRDTRADWKTIRAFARDLRLGRVRATVLREDAYASALCPEGVDRFLEAMRLAHFTHAPGWLMAWLMLIEPQIGFVLRATLHRTRPETALPPRPGETGPGQSLG
ncbi:MAG: hypothetical protein AAFR46_07670 [Pseudomonadota bacterium]